MSELTSALQTIFKWIKEYYPELESSFQTGLTYEEIKSYDNKLSPYCFTSEIYELYQWRNGTLHELDGKAIQVDGNFYRFCQGYPEALDNGKHLGNIDIEPFLALHFLPIENICFKRYEDSFKKGERFGLLHPFQYHSDAGDELICPERVRKKVSPLISSIDQYVHQEYYPSLTAKFMDLADSLESYAYIFEDTRFGRILSIDTIKICRKRKTYKSIYDSNNYDNYIDLGEWTYQKQLCDL